MPSVTVVTTSEDRLDHEGILDLRRAVISARLGESRSALLAHVSAELVASLPVAAAPGEQVLMDIDALNRVGALTDGSVPLAAWLRNAIQLCGGRQEEKIFSDALERVRGGAASPARSEAIKSARQELDQPAATIAHHHPGETHMGARYTVTTTNSTIGAQAIGKNAHAVGSVTLGGPLDTITREQHLVLVQQIQVALITSQRQLDAIDDRLFDALNQFLRLARSVEVERKRMSEIQDKMMDILDEVTAKHFAEGLRPNLVPKTLEVAKSLLKTPAMAEVARKLLET